jgi:murein L,D-transpeptidase YcbB/YkuD
MWTGPRGGILDHGNRGEEPAMTVRRLLSALGAAAASLVSDADAVPADVAVVRGLLARLGVTPGGSEADLADAVRAFQDRVGLPTDGVAGPRTIHQLVHHATRNGRTAWSAEPAAVPPAPARRVRPVTIVLRPAA